MTDPATRRPPRLDALTPVPPNGWIGILGGGQLGRMLAMAAARLGVRTCVLTPERDAPASQCAAETIVAPYNDLGALERFAARVDVVTYEFENVPADTVAALEELGALVAPGARALAIAQDRLVEKEFVRSIGARTAEFYPVDNARTLGEGLIAVGRPAILKTRRLGYDGKGQTAIGAQSAPLDATWDAAVAKAWEEIGARPSILEGFVDFACEISVIGARARDGSVALYDPPENIHRDGILRTSAIPARAADTTINAAKQITSRMLTELDYVGVIGVEFFVLRDGDVLINEFAPRVHNSGHWTLDACACSQFEQHIRAVCGWPLGETSRHSDAVMENLIGAESETWADFAAQPGVCLHLYGKQPALPGRKMGHVTRLSERR